jgi:GR25 family glycosyltransferase involved in LPS biosynthesis
MNEYVIGIQTFVKIDTLQQTIHYLFQCRNIDKYKIIFFIDGIENFIYKDKEHWIENNKIIRQNLYNLQAQNKNVSILLSETNLGAYKGCKYLIDHCMEKSDYVIFLEDDVLFSKDCLEYYEFAYEKYLKNKDYQCLGAACSGTPWVNESNININKLYELNTMNWISSACFGITKDKWEIYKDSRGSSNGDIKMGEDFRKNNQVSIIPAIGRSGRIGYDHPDGFSTYYNAQTDSSYKEMSLPPSDLFSIDYASNQLFFRKNPCTNI